MTIGKLTQVAQDAGIGLKRIAQPLTTRWVLHRTLPEACGKAVEQSFYPFIWGLTYMAGLAVQNRKRIVGM